jgi:hypothetical protein
MKTHLLGGAALAAALTAASPALAQHQDHSGHQAQPPAPQQPQPDHSQHQAEPVEAMPQHPHAAGHAGHSAHDGQVVVADLRQNAAAGSGTALVPSLDVGAHGLHFSTGGWDLMAHGYAWGVYSDQGGPRGDRMAFVESMAMVHAERQLGEGGARLQLRTMLSLDPLIGDRGYPILFATGETAGGEPLVDRQHPHDFFMELAARLEVPVGGATAFLYGGPVGEPALGPSAFMHRGSARYNPEAPITHHWFDSTHITFGVVTAGVRTSQFQLEGSAFRGREPDEERWDIETPRLDSWSVRGTWTPSPNWAAQLSFGRLESPEVLHGDEDEERLTASLSYADRSLSATAAFSSKNRLPGPTLNAWLVEANWNLTDRHSLFGRAELVENDELLGHDDPRHGTVYTVGRATLGYAYRVPLGGALRLALGGSASIHRVPEALQPDYGRTPLAFTLFAKLSLGD